MIIERTSPQLALDDGEQETLEQWVRQPKSAQALARRARIILSCADGLANTVVAAQSGVSKPTVGKWRPRFLAQRLSWRNDWTACPASTIFAGLASTSFAGARPRPGPVAGQRWCGLGTSNSRITECWTTRPMAVAVALRLAKMCSHWENTRANRQLDETRLW